MPFIIFIAWYSSRLAVPVNLQLQGFSIEPIQPQHYQAALDLVCSEFLSNSPLHQAVGMSAELFSSYMSDSWQRILQACPISPLVAVQSDNCTVTGCLIPAPFPSSFDSIQQLSGSRRAISRLLQSLENQYLSGDVMVEKALMVDIAVVSQATAGNGIYQLMRRQIHETAAKSGYTNIYGALSSAVTQRVCVEKFGQKVVSEIYFDAYTDDGTRPFSLIKKPPSIQLVSGTLV